jgi:ribosome-associated protein
MPEKIKKKATEKVVKVKAIKTVKEKVTKPKIEKAIKVKVIKEKKVAKPKPKKVVPDLKSIIIEGILEKYGQEIVVIDFKKFHTSICDYFIICQGNSDKQVEAIAEGVERHVRKQIGMKPVHKEGFQNAQWILLDYFDIIVHIFQPEIRSFYQIEELWADAAITKIN